MLARRERLRCPPASLPVPPCVLATSRLTIHHKSSSLQRDLGANVVEVDVDVDLVVVVDLDGDGNGNGVVPL